MTDMLLSSPLVPLGVNVVRLADVIDEEGILQMVNSIVVRYVSTSGNVIRQAPLTSEDTMIFEVNIASQSYLSQSGHDFAVQLCAASKMTLTNAVPPNSGVEVVQPFYMISEQFTGLTDSSHYTYSQQWQLVVQDIERAIAIDPCVQRGDCSKLFPQNTKQVVGPGETVCGNIIYAPVLPPPNPSIPYSEEYAGVEYADNGDLVYKWDPAQVFMTAEEISLGYCLACTGTKDDTDTFEIINIKTECGPSGQFVRSFFGADTGNKLLSLVGEAPGGGLVRINGETYTPVTAANTENFIATNLPVNGYGYINEFQSLLYVDPTDPSKGTLRVRYGALFPTAIGTEMTHNNVVYQLVGSTPIGRAWVKKLELTLLNPKDYIPLLDCDETTLEEGKIDSCN